VTIILSIEEQRRREAELFAWIESISFVDSEGRVLPPVLEDDDDPGEDTLGYEEARR